MRESTEDAKVSKENNAHPHTIKKFELVEGYVKSWIHKLMNNPDCKEVVFIDCMCNSGIYKDNDGELGVVGKLKVNNTSSK